MLRLTPLALLLAASLSEAVMAQPVQPWMDTSAPPEQRASQLVRIMSTGDKMARVYSEMAMPILGMSVPAGAIGSAAYLPAQHKYHLPALQVTDASLGVGNPANVRPGDGATALPSGLATAASWDPAISYRNGELIGDEAWRKGFNVILAGGVNLARDPRSGRNFEYFGEDPLLAGLMGGNTILGVQSKHVMSTIKHFAMNDQETARQGLSSDINEKALHESDLLAFQIAIEKGQPGAVMCGYNRVNGIYACENQHLLQTILKDQWKYKGFVMSDWGAVHSAEAALTGLDIEMGSQLDKELFGHAWFDGPLKEKIKSSSTYRQRLDDMNQRQLRSMFDIGMIDHPPVKSSIDYATHTESVRQAAEDGIVLLRNQSSFLPLKNQKQTVLVIGGHADKGVISGAGSAQVTPVGGPALSIPTGGEGQLNATRFQVWDNSSPLVALKKAMPDVKFIYNDGRNAGEAAALAKKADKVIIFATQWMMESYDTYDLSLSEGQDATIGAVANSNPNTAVVLETGGAVDMPWLNKTQAVLEAWYPGSAGGEAIANIISGKVNPSGHLPVTFPRSVNQLPRPQIVGYGQADNARINVDYNIEGSDVGYRWFARNNEKPLYPFGYGLSYTSFTYEGLKVSSESPLHVSLTVTNTGKMPGKAVPQLYLTSVNDTRRVRLAGWQKVTLRPGERKTVEMIVDPRIIAEYSPQDAEWKIAAGDYEFAAGASSEDLALTQKVKLASLHFKDKAVSH